MYFLRNNAERTWIRFFAWKVSIIKDRDVVNPRRVHFGGHGKSGCGCIRRQKANFLPLKSTLLQGDRQRRRAANRRGRDRDAERRIVEGETETPSARVRWLVRGAAEGRSSCACQGTLNGIPNADWYVLALSYVRNRPNLPPNPPPTPPQDRDAERQITETKTKTETPRRFTARRLCLSPCNNVLFKGKKIAFCLWIQPQTDFRTRQNVRVLD